MLTDSGWKVQDTRKARAPVAAQRGSERKRQQKHSKSEKGSKFQVGGTRLTIIHCGIGPNTAHAGGTHEQRAIASSSCISASKKIECRFALIGWCSSGEAQTPAAGKNAFHAGTPAEESAREKELTVETGLGWNAHGCGVERGAFAK